jgi:hypothetical protein
VLASNAIQSHPVWYLDLNILAVKALRVPRLNKELGFVEEGLMV